MKENDFFPFLARLVYDLGVDESRTIAVAMILYSTVIVLSALGTWFFTRHIINAGIYRWVKKTHVKWDDALADHKVLARTDNNPRRRTYSVQGLPAGNSAFR